MYLITSVSCQGQMDLEREKSNTGMSQVNSIDTITRLELSNRLEVLLINCKDTFCDRIEIFDTTQQIGRILLPIPDLEVKNFQIDNLEETKSGFRLTVSWGGGRNFYGRVFYFEYIIDEKSLFLSRIIKTNFGEGSEMTDSLEVILKSPIRIENLELIVFIENE
jgi:hypothetical protein